MSVRPSPRVSDISTPAGAGHTVVLIDRNGKLFARGLLRWRVKIYLMS